MVFTVEDATGCGVLGAAGVGAGAGRGAGAAAAGCGDAGGTGVLLQPANTAIQTAVIDTNEAVLIETLLSAATARVGDQTKVTRACRQKAILSQFNLSQWKVTTRPLARVVALGEASEREDYWPRESVVADRRPICDDMYSRRGEAEDRSSAAQVGSYATRTHCQVFASNPLKLLRASLGKVRVQRMRALAQQGTEPVDTPRIAKFQMQTSPDELRIALDNDSDLV